MFQASGQAAAAYFWQESNTVIEQAQRVLVSFLGSNYFFLGILLFEAGRVPVHNPHGREADGIGQWVKPIIHTELIQERSEGGHTAGVGIVPDL
jgi:hypothetical protein